MTELCLIGGGSNYMTAAPAAAARATARAGDLVSQGFPAASLRCADPLAEARERIARAVPGIDCNIKGRKHD